MLTASAALWDKALFYTGEWNCGEDFGLIAKR